MESSPRSWGCFSSPTSPNERDGVFPTLVGVFPYDDAHIPANHRLPHARGGVSRVTCILWTNGRSSPRSWGCFYGMVMPDGKPDVFPTLVGVFLFVYVEKQRLNGLPHARGGVSA